MDTDRRIVGQHIGAALRHAREASRRNLAKAPIEEIRRQCAKALDCLGCIVWEPERGNDREA